MSDLLPDNATAAEHALDDATARISDIPVPVRDVWSPENCPEHLLPWLAWAFSVDDWDSDWSEQQKRDTIASAIKVQQHKGTIGAVRTAMAALGIDAQVQEWFSQSPEADPYTYRLMLDAEQTTVTQTQISRLLGLVENTKSLRSHLSEVLVSATSTSELIVATAPGVGSEITVKHTGQPLVINTMAIVLGP